MMNSSPWPWRVLATILMFVLVWVASLSYRAGGLNTRAGATDERARTNTTQIEDLRKTLHTLDTRTAVMDSKLDRVLRKNGLDPEEN